MPILFYDLTCIKNSNNRSNMKVFLSTYQGFERGPEASTIYLARPTLDTRIFSQISVSLHLKAIYNIKSYLQKIHFPLNKNFDLIRNR